jgi:hypothetical protein
MAPLLCRTQQPPGKESGPNRMQCTVNLSQGAASASDYRVIHNCRTVMKDIVLEIIWSTKYKYFFFRFAAVFNVTTFLLWCRFVLLWLFDGGSALRVCGSAYSRGSQTVGRAPRGFVLVLCGGRLGLLVWGTWLFWTKNERKIKYFFCQALWFVEIWSLLCSIT